MEKIRIGNDIHIEWSIFRDNQPEVFEGKDVEVRLMHTRTRDVMPLEWVISDGVVSATFYGKDQIDTGDYKLMLVENNGAPNMATIDECKAFTLVQCSCQEQKEEPSTSLQLYKVQLVSSFALSGGGNISVEGYPNVDELEEVKELSGNENIIITDTEGNKKTTIGNLKEYVVKDISELPPFRIFENESDYNAVKDELGDCVVCLRDTGVLLYHVYGKAEDGGGEIEDKYIRFADPEVQRILVENFSADGVGMTSEDIAKVTSIGTVFKGNTEITSFDELEKFTGVTSLVAAAFRSCSNLQSVSLDNIEEINSGVFADSALGGELSIPKLKNIIGTGIFDGHFCYTNIVKISNLGSITALPNGYHTNTLGVFGKCSKLEKAILPTSIQDIGDLSFYDCQALKEVNFDELVNLKRIGISAFSSCDLSYTNGLNLPLLETLCDNSFVNTNLSGKVNLPNLTTIRTNYGNVFTNSKITEVTSLGKITTLPSGYNWNYGVFRNCTELTKVILPNTLETIGQDAFSGCSVLANVEFGNSIKTIGARAFINCISLDSSIPASVTEIQTEAFLGCIGMKGIVNCPNLTSIKPNPFEGTMITGVVDLGHITILPNENTHLWRGVFYNCQALKYVILPESLTTIENVSFNKCTALNAIIFKNAVPATIGIDSFHGNDATIYVPDASMEAYKTATNWSQYSSRIKGISELPIDNAELYEEIKDYLN